MACARFARVFRAACCRPPPFSACPSVLLDQPHMMARLFSERRPRSPAPAQHKKLLRIRRITQRGQHRVGGWRLDGAVSSGRPRVRIRLRNVQGADISSPITIFCRTPHTRLSGASSATAALPLSSSNHHLQSRMKPIHLVAGRSPTFCASL